MFKYDIFVTLDKRTKRARCLALLKGDLPRVKVYQYVSTVNARDADDAVAVCVMAMYNVNLATNQYVL